MSNKEHDEKRISRDNIYEGKIISVYKDMVELKNNEIISREIIEHPGGVGILAVDDNNNLIMVRQYRYGAGKALLELPAGKIDGTEDPKDCAVREFKEETGYSAENMVHLAEFYPTPAYDNEKIYVYHASGLTMGEQDLDENEFLSLEYVPFDKALEMCMNGEIEDAKTIIGIMLYNQNKID